MISKSCSVSKITALIICMLGVGTLEVGAWADSTVEAGNQYTWGSNIGWIDWRAQPASGAVFTTRTVSGYIYSANIGWISLGDGTPTNGIAYSNASASDFGVNVDSSSDAANFLLSGYAWSANAGWISFNATDPTYRPRVQKGSGVLKGYAWGANIGWISLEMPESIVITGLGRSTGAENWALY